MLWLCIFCLKPYCPCMWINDWTMHLCDIWSALLHPWYACVCGANSGGWPPHASIDKPKLTPRGLSFSQPFLVLVLWIISTVNQLLKKLLSLFSLTLHVKAERGVFIPGTRIFIFHFSVLITGFKEHSLSTETIWMLALYTETIIIMSRTKSRCFRCPTSITAFTMLTALRIESWKWYKICPKRDSRGLVQVYPLGSCFNNLNWASCEGSQCIRPSPSIHARLYAYRLIQLSASVHVASQVLITSAAVPISGEPTRMAEGFEAQFGVGNLGHFLFTALLMPSILRAAEEDFAYRARVV